MNLSRIVVASNNAGKLKEFQQLLCPLGLEFIPQTNITVEGEKAKEALELIEALEDHDDVQNVYSNLELTESMMA